MNLNSQGNDRGWLGVIPSFPAENQQVLEEGIQLSGTRKQHGFLSMPFSKPGAPDRCHDKTKLQQEGASKQFLGGPYAGSNTHPELELH